MKAIKTEEALIFLSRKSMYLDEWNRVACDQDDIESLVFDSSKYQYSLACHLVDWLNIDKNYLIQIDNSTWPQQEEIFVFFDVVGRIESIPNLDFCKSFLMLSSDYDNRESFLSSAMLQIYFGLKFEWHIDFVGDMNEVGHRLRMSDGIVYLYGSAINIKDGGNLKKKLEDNPQCLSGWQLKIERE